MARKPRLHMAGGVYHAILRGNAGQAIFHSEEDRRHFENLVAEGVKRFGHRIHAYCWMDNHVHLALQVGKIGLPRIIQNLAFRYTRWVNRREHRRGHLFQGRYHALLVDMDSYLLELVRYIHLNPLRAGLVSDPAEFEDSSHRAYLGCTPVPWLTTDWVLAQFSPVLAAARARYRRFIEDGRSMTRRSEFYRGALDTRILGDEQFAERVEREASVREAQSAPAEQIITTVCRVLGVEESALASASRERDLAQARALIAYLVGEYGRDTITDLGRRLNRDIATLSNGARMIRVRLAEDTTLQAKVAKATSGLFGK